MSFQDSLPYPIMGRCPRQCDLRVDLPSLMHALITAMRELRGWLALLLYHPRGSHYKHNYPVSCAAIPPLPSLVRSPHMPRQCINCREITSYWLQITTHHPITHPPSLPSAVELQRAGNQIIAAAASMPVFMLEVTP